MTPLFSREARRICNVAKSGEARKAATTPLHPTSRILIYLLAALAIPGLPFFMLPVLLLAPFLYLVLQRRTPLRLVWRTRWLLLVLLFGYAYSLPGEPVWPVLGGVLSGLSPSWEGVQHGAKQVARLVILLLWLDMLVLRLPADRLLTGLYQLMQPFSRLGIDPGRVALRLELTLRAIEAMERGSGNLKSLLKLDFQIEFAQQIQLHLSPLRFIDIALPGVVLASILGVWLHTA